MPKPQLQSAHPPKSTRPYSPKSWVGEDRPGREEGVRFGALQLSDRQVRAIVKWMPAEHTSGPDSPFFQLDMAGYMRNVGRILEHEGARVVTFMAEEKLLDPEQDPVEALQLLLDELQELRSEASRK